MDTEFGKFIKFGIVCEFIKNIEHNHRYNAVHFLSTHANVMNFDSVIMEDTLRITFFLLLITFSKLSVSGSWNTEKTISPMDDSQTIFMYINAESPISAWVNETVTPQLVLRFKEGKFSAYLKLNVLTKVESNDERTITLRFDSKKAFDVKSSLSTNRKSVFFEDPRDIAKRIYESDKLTIRFTPFNSNPVTTTFDLTGFRESSNELLQSAGIDFDDKNQTFIEEYKKALKGNTAVSTYGINIKDNVVTIDTESKNWKSFAREYGAEKRITSALTAFNLLPKEIDFKIKVSISGSSIRENLSSESGPPFSKEELENIFNKALVNSNIDREKLVSVTLQEAEPEYWKDGVPDILKGRVRKTNESIRLDVEVF